MAGFLTPVLVLLSGDFELRQKFRYDLQDFSPPISMKFGMYVEVMVMDDIVIRPDPWSRSKTWDLESWKFFDFQTVSSSICNGSWQVRDDS